MWILRFLNGPLAGQMVQVNKSSMLLGRASSCDIRLQTPNVSKEHTRIEVFDDKLIVSDAGSRNGTFVNGVQVRSQKVKSGDKISIHDIFIEVQRMPENWANQLRQPSHSRPAPQPAYHGSAAYDVQQSRQRQQQVDLPPENSGSPLQNLMQDKLPQLAQTVQEYIEKVVLPGFFKLPEIFEFKWVLAGMMALFILLVTTLSTIPLTRILRSSIEEESRQHAMTIATTLARINIPALAQGVDTGVSVDIATSRPGVSKAFIISNVDGNVISPAGQAGQYLSLPYVHEGRKLDHESVKQVDDNSIVAMYPVRFYNQDTGAQAITAWAVVFYDMTSLAVDNGQVLSLFITTLFISLILGFGLFYALYKVIEHPIQSMNEQLDSALKEGLETVQVNYLFPAMQLLASNVSSALARALNGSQDNPNRIMEYDRNREITNLVELNGFAAMGVRAADLSIAAVNRGFEERSGMQAANLLTMTINEITDQSLKLSLADLVERVDKNPDDMAANDLEFSGVSFQIIAQAVYGSAKISYYLIILVPKEAGQ
jgi:hypothetical protein